MEKKKLKVAIVGSRTFSDYETLKEIIHNELEINTIEMIVSGGASGVDSLAERYAKENCIKMLIIPANWKLHGMSAGYKRNVDIWDACDIGIAIWDGESKGTKHSFKIAKKQNKKLYIYNYKENKLWVN